MMKRRKSKKELGFSLIEMLLVMVIISSIVLMGVQYFERRTEELMIDKTVSDIQQILNAAAAYYVANGQWPALTNTMDCLKGKTATCTVPYLSASITTNPFKQSEIYWPPGDPDWPRFYVTTFITLGTKGYLIAPIIASRVPGGEVVGLAGRTTGVKEPSKVGVCSATMNKGGTKGCTLIASIGIPSQNLATANAVNFAGAYHHGACVPVPTCPVDSAGNTTTPQIILVPSSVSGLNDVGVGASSEWNNLYPISSFTAYPSSATPSATPPNCTNGTSPSTPPCGTLSGNTPASGKYWRACLQVITAKGDVATTSSATPAQTTSPTVPWGGNVWMIGFTRCAITNEPSGSATTVFTK